MRRKRGIGFLVLLALCLWRGNARVVYAVECTQHEYKSYVTRFAEEEVEGEREYVCIYCGDTYTETMPKTGHDFGPYITEKEASCASEGLEVRECKACGVTEYQVLPFLNQHRFAEWQTVRDAECETPGLRQRVCQDCGQAEAEETTPALGHVYDEMIYPATCTEAGETRYTCQYCGDSYSSESVDALGHKYGDEFIEQEPTEDEEGLAVRICEHDETHILQRSIPCLEPIETEETTVKETETETIAVPEEEPEREVNPVEAAVVGANTCLFGTFFILIKRDYNVLRWEKRNRRLMYKRGEWK